MAKEPSCVFCGQPWKVQLETEKGPVRLCLADAEYAMEVREQRTPKQKEAWKRFLHRIFG